MPPGRRHGTFDYGRENIFLAHKIVVNQALLMLAWRRYQRFGGLESL